MLCGSVVSATVEVGTTVAQPWRCAYEDENGRCLNNRHEDSIYCIWHRQFLAMKGGNTYECTTAPESV